MSTSESTLIQKPKTTYPYSTKSFIISLNQAAPRRFISKNFFDFLDP